MRRNAPLSAVPMAGDRVSKHQQRTTLSMQPLHGICHLLTHLGHGRGILRARTGVGTAIDHKRVEAGQCCILGEHLTHRIRRWLSNVAPPGPACPLAQSSLEGSLRARVQIVVADEPNGKLAVAGQPAVPRVLRHDRLRLQHVRQRRSEESSKTVTCFVVDLMMARG